RAAPRRPRRPSTAAWLPSAARHRRAGRRRRGRRARAWRGAGGRGRIRGPGCGKRRRAVPWCGASPECGILRSLSRSSPARGLRRRDAPRGAPLLAEVALRRALEARAALLAAEVPGLSVELERGRVGLDLHAHAGEVALVLADGALGAGHAG